MGSAGAGLASGQTVKELIHLPDGGAGIRRAVKEYFGNETNLNCFALCKPTDNEGMIETID